MFNMNVVRLNYFLDLLSSHSSGMNSSTSTTALR